MVPLASVCQDALRYLGSHYSHLHLVNSALISSAAQKLRDSYSQIRQSQVKKEYNVHDGSLSCPVRPVNPNHTLGRSPVFQGIPAVGPILKLRPAQDPLCAILISFF